MEIDHRLPQGSRLKGYHFESYESYSVTQAISRTTFPLAFPSRNVLCASAACSRGKLRPIRTISLPASARSPSFTRSACSRRTNTIGYSETGSTTEHTLVRVLLTSG